MGLATAAELSAHHIHHLPADTGSLFAGLVIAGALLGVIGVALGYITRSMIAAVVGWVLFVELAILHTLAPDLARWLITGAASALTTPAVPGSATLSPATAVAVLSAYAVVLLAVASRLGARVQSEPYTRGPASLTSVIRWAGPAVAGGGIGKDGPLPGRGPHCGRGGMTMGQDVPRRASLAEARAARIGRPQAAAGYEQARLRFELAEAVRARREELGWSQRQLAERAGMTQPGVARFEAGGTTPTLPLLERLAAALGLTLAVSLEPAGRRSA